MLSGLGILEAWVARANAAHNPAAAAAIKLAAIDAIPSYSPFNKLVRKPGKKTK
jgi:hypothetical protein